MAYVNNKYGKLIDFDFAKTIMDQDMAKEVRRAVFPCNDQVFYAAYCEAHLEKYGEPFKLEDEHPAKVDPRAV